MKKLTVSQLIQVADLIANLPDTGDSTELNLAEWLDVEHVYYSKDHDNMRFQVYQETNNLLEPAYMEFTALSLLKAIGNWHAAVAYAMVEESQEYMDHVMPFKWVRCAVLSSLLGFESGYTPGADFDNFTESENGVFWGSRNNLKVVTAYGEQEFGIAEFLDGVM